MRINETNVFGGLRGLLVWAGLLLAAGVCAQDALHPSKRISQYSLYTWTVEDGLPAIAITDIYQSPDQYLWLGTYNGLARFDGASFTVFTTENTPLLRSSSIRVFCSVGDTLWIGTQKGLVRYHDQHFEADPLLGELNNYSIESLHADEAGGLWIGTTSNGLFCYEGRRLRAIGELSGSPIKDIASDASGNVWAGSDQGHLYRVKGGTLEAWATPEETGGISSLYLDRQGKLWVACQKSLFAVGQNGLKEQQQVPLAGVASLAEDAYGMLWLSSNQGLFRYSKAKGTLEGFSEKEGLPSNIIRTMLFDHEGNLWVASYRSGLFLLTDGVFSCYTEQEGLPNAVATHLLPIGSRYWIATEGGQISVLESDSLRTLALSKPMPSPRIKDLMLDRKGQVWASTYGGLVKMRQNGEILRIYSDEEVGSNARMTLEDPQGHIWAGTRRKGLVKLVGEEPVLRLNAENGLSSNFIMSIDRCRDGSLWVGTKNGINIVKGDSVAGLLQADDGLPSNMVFNVYEDAAGDKWVATDLGLAHLRADKITVIDIENGLPEQVIFDIQEDAQGYMWLSSNSGVSRVAKAELLAVAEGKTRRVYARHYDRSDGMKSEECLGAAKMTQDAQGRIWIPTVQGIAVVDPSQLEEQEHLFQVRIEGVSTEHRTYRLNEGPIIIPPGSKRLEIVFTAFNYRSPKKINFRCKLAPFDADWVDLGRKRSIAYTNLPPDQYALQVQAAFEGYGYQPEGEAKLAFTTEPYFYQTTWFYLIVLANIGLAAFLLYTWRIRHLRRREEELARKVEERTHEIAQQRDQIDQQRTALENSLNDLQMAQSQLVQSEKLASIGQLTAGIAHEINNPINFVYAGVDALRSVADELMEVLDAYGALDDAEPEAREALLQQALALKEELDFESLRTDVYGLIGDISNGAQRTTEIVRSLRTFSRDDSDLSTQASLAELLDATLVVLRNLYKGRVEIVRQYEEVPSIQCHAGKLGQVFSNIITNAVQAIEGPGTVTLSLYRLPPGHPRWHASLNPHAEYVQLVIADDGPGIPEHVRQRIFDPFFTTKEVGKGTGLGLSIVYGIVEKHQGRIDLETAVGKGTSFIITLPVKPLSETQANDDEASN